MAAKSAYPRALADLIAALTRLPGIGGRTAERLALAMLGWPEEQLAALGECIATLPERVRHCTRCGNLAEGELCAICSDPTRDATALCVVEQASQIVVIERSGSFRGLYHVLGGRLAPLEGKGPETLHLDTLRERVGQGAVQELILATSPDVEGEATAAYLAEEFRSCGVRITRIAAGIPVGADLSFADSATIAMALNARRPLDGLAP